MCQGFLGAVQHWVRKTEKVPTVDILVKRADTTHKVTASIPGSTQMPKYSLKKINGQSQIIFYTFKINKLPLLITIRKSSLGVKDLACYPAK